MPAQGASPFVRARDADAPGAPVIFVQARQGRAPGHFPMPGGYAHYKGGRYVVFGWGYRRTDVTQHRPVVLYCSAAGEWFIRDGSTWFDDVGDGRTRFRRAF